MSLVQDAAPNDPIFLLWKIARVWIADAIDAFGPPAEIAALMVRKTRRAVKRRVKALETLVTKLLLVEAAKLAPIKPTSVQADRRHLAGMPAGSRRSAHASDPADPSTWRVRFELRIPSAEPPRARPVNSGPRIRDLSPPLLVRDIFAEQARRAQVLRMASMRTAVPNPARERAKAEKLARRFEALMRAVANPAPHARRLKRKLCALPQRRYDAAMRVAMALPPRGQGHPAVNARAEFEACRAVPEAIAPPPAPDSS